MNLNKRCRVCGDISKCKFSYNALTCQSCSVFFHRNKFHLVNDNIKELTCRKNESCEIDVSTRRKCSYCRLLKCVSIGMQHSPHEKCEETESSSEASQFFDHEIEREFSLCTNEYSDNSNNLLEDLKLPKKRTARELNKNELQSIEEVRDAMRVFADELTAPNVRHAETAIDAAKIPEIYFRWIVLYCQKISAFNLLKPADQFIILKNFCFDILAIRWTMNFDRKRMGFYVFSNDSLDEVLLIDLETAKDVQNKHLIDYNIRVGILLQNELDNDLILRDLLCAQLLFKPRENLSGVEFIRYQHSYYSRLLRLYLEQKFKNILKADKKYLSLMSLLEEMPQLKENERKIHSEMDAGAIPHIVAEMYNLTI